MKNTTIKEFLDKFPNDDACLDHIMTVRYGKRGQCEKCGKETNFSKISNQRAYACQWCGHHLYPCVGTPFESSRTPLQLWFYAFYLFTNTRSGVSAKELERQLGVTYKTAWRMAKIIREHMGKVGGSGGLSGIVEIDETMIGSPKPGKRGRGAEGKTVVMGLVERDGNIKTEYPPNLKRETLQGIIEENVETGSEVHTDEFLSYKGIDNKGYTHKTVNHGRKEYQREDVHVNTVENFWARLKLSIKGTHIHVSDKYLQNYIGEFEYRFNSRKNPHLMFDELISTYQ